jgi:hypothetical protein
MTTREALTVAGRELFLNSWRLVPVNAMLGLVLAVGVAATFATPLALVLLVLAGPLAAALVHCAVTLVRTEKLVLADALDGLRLHWRRGLVLAAFGVASVGLGVQAVRVYVGSPALVPLAFLAVYLLVLLGIYQVVVWTLAIADPDRPLRAVPRQAAALVARRPAATLGLGLALLLVNSIGLAAGVMPFLTVTIAYSSLAAAYFVLPVRRK